MSSASISRLRSVSSLKLLSFLVPCHEGHFDVFRNWLLGDKLDPPARSRLECHLRRFFDSFASGEVNVMTLWFCHDVTFLCVHSVSAFLPFLSTFNRAALVAHGSPPLRPAYGARPD